MHPNFSPLQFQSPSISRR